MEVVALSDQLAVRVINLFYSYPDGTRALDDVSLTVRTGESVGLLGPNGAGKSTLSLHLNGILTAAAGSVEIMGLEVNKRNLRQIRGLVGLVFQDPDDQLFSPTVKEDVAFGPLNQKLDPALVEEAVRQALEWVSMSGSEERSPYHMSFGEKKRIALATVLSMDPRILVLDEPVSNLDPRGRREFIELIRSLGVTKLTITHDLEMARAICDRLVIMDAGTVAADGPAASILSDHALLEQHGLV